MELIIKKYDELSLDELYEILRIRVSIFVVEQQCPYQEIDGKDEGAYHMFLRDDDGIAAYLRVMGDGPSADGSYGEISLGRVLTVRRGLGLGYEILCEGIRFATEELGAKRIKIEAQTYAKGFYEKAGFRQISDEFMDDGIPHIYMMLECV